MSPYTATLEAIIDFIYVLPEYRFGTVPGGILMGDFEKWANEEGATTVYCANPMGDAGARIMRRYGYDESQRTYKKVL